METISSLEARYTNRALMRDLARFVQPYKWKFFLGSLFRLSSDIVWLYNAYAFALLINFFTNIKAEESFMPALYIVLLWTLAALWRQYSMFMAKKLCYEVAEKVAVDCDIDTMAHLFKLDIAWHERENAGNKMKRIFNGTLGIKGLGRMWVNNVIEIGVNFVGMIFILAQFDLTVAGLTILFMVTFYFLSVYFIKKVGVVARAINVADEEVTGLLFEGFNNIRTVKVLGMAEALMKIIAAEYKKYVDLVFRRIFINQIGHNAEVVWAHIFRTGILLFIGWGIFHGHYEVGFLVLFYGYFNQLWESVNELSYVSEEIIVAKQAIARLVAIRQEPIRIDYEEGKKNFPEHWQTIAFQSISFSYGKEFVLHDVSFEVRRGEKIGIVGLSGAGKSTLFKLLLKEYEGFAGDILIDGVPIQNLKKSDYFNHVAVVLQDTELFNFSLRDNITITNYEEKDNSALLEKALRVAHVNDFMRRMPAGIDTVIGEKGVRLSGGEKQRVGIARAVFKEPELLLLDEATSHLDIESEEKIKESLHEFFKEVTAIVIAHRLTTIKEMDRIIVLEDGKIVEEGSFGTLYDKKGRFYELWEKQKL